MIVVLEGDCSNTQALAELLRHDGIESIPFRFPFDRDPGRLARELAHLCEALGTTVAAAEEMRVALLELRQELRLLETRGLAYRPGTPRSCCCSRRTS